MKTRTLLVIFVISAIAQVIVGSALLLAFSADRPTVAILGLSVLVLAVGGLIVSILGLRSYRASMNARATRLANVERRVAEFENGIREVRSARIDSARALEERLRAVDGKLSSLTNAPAPADASPSSVVASLVALGSAQGMPMGTYLSQSQAAEAVRAALETGPVLDVVPYVSAFPNVADELSLSEARVLLKTLRRLGYLRYAVPVVQSIAERFGNPADARAASLYASELALYEGQVDLSFDLPAMDALLERDTVMHFVGKALPDTQSGYTLRTQYTVDAQRRRGINPVVVAHAGAGSRAHERTETYEFDGIRYYELGGPQRGAVPWDDWLKSNVAALAEVVRLVRPAAIHTHSDFINAMIALPVAKSYGIPLVNETRGFWEESWLSRTATAEGWDDLAQIDAKVGLPDMYRLRVEREAETRGASDAVVTLARVMRDHIDAVGRELEFPVPAVSIAPNAVEPKDFPVQPQNQLLRAELGLEPGELVVGYISSIVEYEGIDTLIRGVHELQTTLQTVAEALVDSRTSDTGPDGGEPLNASSTSASRAGTSGGLTSAEANEASEAGPDEVRASLAERLALVHPSSSQSDLDARSAALIEAAAPLAKLPVRLLVVGDGAELGNLKALAAELGLTNVIFTGRVPHDRVLDYYGLIDLFVVPRKRAAVTELVTPLKPFEAMSTGRPCLFSDVGALVEIAEDSGAAELFRAGDHHHLATRIAELLSDRARLTQMSERGAEWVRRERSWDMNAETYLGVYRSLGVQPRHADRSADLRSSTSVDDREESQ